MPNTTAVDTDGVNASASNLEEAAGQARSTTSNTPEVTDSRFAALSAGAAEESSEAEGKVERTAENTRSAAKAIDNKDRENRSNVERASDSPSTSSGRRSSPTSGDDYVPTAPAIPSVTPASQVPPVQQAPVAPPMAMRNPPQQPYYPQYAQPTPGMLAPNSTGAGAMQSNTVSLTPQQMRVLAEHLVDSRGDGGGGSGGSGGSSGGGGGSSSGPTRGKDIDLSDIDGEYQEAVLELSERVVDADIPYAWGGGTLEGPSGGLAGDNATADAHGDYNKTGFDCSGLSRFITYQTTGIEIPRVAADQYNFCIPTDEPQIGDLGFPAGGSPGHVVVYVGDGMVVEAQQSGTNIMYSEVSSKGDYVWGIVPGGPNDI